MSYDEKLAMRVRKSLSRKQGFSERKMFGGLCFMLNGNMCGGVLDGDLIVRVMPEEYAAMMKRPHTRAFDFTGKPMKGFVVVAAPGCRSDASLKNWVAVGARCARTLPAKRKKSPRNK
jgi:TfoX/Sxy family transcriptional regulator of competence genes